MQIKRWHVDKATPCRIAFKRGGERHLSFLAISKETSGWVFLSEELPYKKHHGIVCVLAGTLGWFQGMYFFCFSFLFMHPNESDSPFPFLFLFLGFFPFRGFFLLALLYYFFDVLAVGIESSRMFFFTIFLLDSQILWIDELFSM